MIISEHRLLGVHQRDSPHWNARQADASIDLIVVHNISLPPGEFGTGVPTALFLGELDAATRQRFPDLAQSRVSAHVLIERTGMVTQFVSFDREAWHAGKSAWRGRPACNGFSVGIELEGTDTLPFEDCQYRVLEDIVRALRRCYPTIGADAVVGHEHIAPGRKTDPGPAFDWQRLRSALGRQ